MKTWQTTFSCITNCWVPNDPEGIKNEKLKLAGAIRIAQLLFIFNFFFLGTVLSTQQQNRFKQNT